MCVYVMYVTPICDIEDGSINDNTWPRIDCISGFATGAQGMSSLVEWDPLLATAISSSKMLVVEGYLWELPETVDAIARACVAAKEKGVMVALTASDVSCVLRFRQHFWYECLLNLSRTLPQLYSMCCFVVIEPSNKQFASVFYMRYGGQSLSQGENGEGRKHVALKHHNY